MTAVMMRGQKAKTASWSSTFPKEQSTEQQSVLFVKKLLAVSVSNIMYLRAIFPESAFADRAIEDLHVKILREDNSCPGASDVVQWVRGCYEAFERKYLRQVIMGIYKDPNNDETLIESYTFRFTYNKSPTMNVYRNNEHIAIAEAASETKKATLALLRTLIILMQTLRPLPNDVMLTMKLLYYDEVTPPDYEPPGFQRAKSDTFQYDTETLNVNVGDVRTVSQDQVKIIDEIVPETQSRDMPHAPPGKFQELPKESIIKPVINLEDDENATQEYVAGNNKARRKKDRQKKKSSQNMKSTSTSTVANAQSETMDTLSQKTTQMNLSPSKKEKPNYEATKDTVTRRLTRSTKRTASSLQHDNLKFYVEDTQELSSQEPEPKLKRIKASSTRKKILV